MSQPSEKPPTPPRQISGSERTSCLLHRSWNKGPGKQPYNSYLKEDLKNNKVAIPFEEFLTHILRVSPEWREQKEILIDEIAESKEYDTKLKAYTAEVARETDAYYRFAELANYVMQQLQGDKEPEPDICFCRNDPIVVRGSRKPDVCTIDQNEGERGGVDNLSNKGPAECPFCWTDVISFWDFKRMISNLTFLMNETHPTSSSSSQSGVVGSLSNDAMSQYSQATATLARARTTGSNTLANALFGQSSKKRTAPEHDSDMSSRKRAKTNSEQSDSEQSGTKTRAQDRSSLQCASYALELLSDGGLRNHIIAGSVTDQFIKLLYYDRSTIVESTPVDFVTDRTTFIALLIGLATLTPKQWGSDSLVRFPYGTRPPRLEQDTVVSFRTLEGQTIKLEEGKVLQLGKTVYHEHGLIGRGTWILRAKLQEHSGSNSGPDVIVKLSWSLKSRNSEHVMINKARSDATLCGDQWVLDHLPNVLHAQDFDQTDEEPVKGVMELLGDKYEPRVLRLQVMEELFPITELVKPSDLAKAFRNIFECYEWLYTKAEIFHRDISLNNMMYRENKDGEIFGVLNDYDLAIFRSNTNPSSKTCTGTQPFMAIDLLGENPDVHRYRHDLESMFYVIVFVTSRYHEGKEIRHPPLQEWSDLDEDYLKLTKVRFIHNALPPTTPSYASLFTWTMKMRQMLVAGHRACVDYQEARAFGDAAATPVFDFETLDGHCSFETFRAILEYPVA